jgi:hypothetical protein
MGDEHSEIPDNGFLILIIFGGKEKRELSSLSG